MTVRHVSGGACSRARVGLRRCVSFESVFCERPEGMAGHFPPVGNSGRIGSVCWLRMQSIGCDSDGYWQGTMVGCVMFFWRSASAQVRWCMVEVDVQANEYGEVSMDDCQSRRRGRP